MFFCFYKLKYYYLLQLIKNYDKYRELQRNATIYKCC
jgi:hypothetical protein